MTKTKTNFRKCYVKPDMEVTWMDPEDLMQGVGGSAEHFTPEGGEGIGNQAKSLRAFEFTEDESQDVWGCDYELEW